MKLTHHTTNDHRSDRQDPMRIFSGRLHATHGLGRVTAVAVLAAFLGALPACSAQTGDKALADLRVSAEQGDAEASFKLGLMYVAGEDVPQDHAEAVRWLQLAAEQGHAEAQFYLGIMYADAEVVRRYEGDDDLLVLDDEVQFAIWLRSAIGEGVTQDDAEAVRWLQLAAEQGHAWAQFSLGNRYANGEGVPQDDTEAERWSRLAANQGNSMAQFLLLDELEGTEALRWLRRAAERDHHAWAQFFLGIIYDSGEDFKDLGDLGVLEDDAEALRWFRLAAEQGHAESEAYIRDIESRRAAEQGDAEAQFHLGRLYDFGSRSTPLDNAEAERWYRLAAEQGHAEAAFTLGLMYAMGDLDVPKDAAMAVRWYRRAADLGYAEAASMLWRIYTNGEGVPQDDTAAWIWLWRAADLGESWAQNRRGEEYAADKETAEAERWYRLAAEQGYAEAQFNLGAMYDDGEGVPQDYAEAERWYRLAATQGYAEAQNNLGAMYANGRGVPQDDVLAHMWLNLAAAKSTGEDRERFVAGRDAVADRMTREDLIEAQRLAREWSPE